MGIYRTTAEFEGVGVNEFGLYLPFPKPTDKFMLQAFSTKSGTGVSIYGDHAELNSIHKTIHHFADTLDETNDAQKAQFQLLMNLAYEVRKASNGQRLIEPFIYPGDDIKHTLYGFQLVWTDALIFLHVLRHNAGYAQSTKLHQAHLYTLEHVVEKALVDYDPVGAEAIKQLLSRGFMMFDGYVFMLYQALHIKFVTLKPGKTRFRKIPQLIQSHFSVSGTHHKELIASFEVSALQQNCRVTDLEFSDFPEIVW